MLDCTPTLIVLNLKYRKSVLCIESISIMVIFNDQISKYGSLPCFAWISPNDHQCVTTRSCALWSQCFLLCGCMSTKWLISSVRDKRLVSMAASCAHVNMPAVCADKAWHYGFLSLSLSASVQPWGLHKMREMDPCIGTEFFVRHLTCSWLICQTQSKQGSRRFQSLANITCLYLYKLYSLVLLCRKKFDTVADMSTVFSAKMFYVMPFSPQEIPTKSVIVVII